MPDAFTLFDLPRRPWLNADRLKDEFHRRSATQHPDAGGDADGFTQLNAAHQILRDPVARVRHLLELEAPATLASAQAIPPDLAEVFMQIGALRRALDVFWKRNAQASSPLARALLAPDKIALRTNVESLIESVAGRHTGVLDELRALDETWKTARPTTRLAEILYSLSFLGKWEDQLRNDLLKLSLELSPRTES